MNEWWEDSMIHRTKSCLRLIVYRSKATAFCLTAMCTEMDSFTSSLPAACCSLQVQYMSISHAVWYLLVLLSDDAFGAVFVVCALVLTTWTLIITMTIMTPKDTYVIKKPVLQVNLSFNFCGLTLALLLFQVHCSSTSFLMTVICTTR